MIDFKNAKYAVLGFACADNIHDLNTKKRLWFAYDNFLEVAAVKVEKGKITSHFSSFISPEDYNLEDVEIDGFFDTLGVTAAHLVGAPEFSRAAEKVFEFAKECVLVETPNGSYNALENFTKKAGVPGLIFNNPVIHMANVLKAFNLQRSVERYGRFEDMSVAQLAFLLNGKGATWEDVFAEFNVFTLDEDLNNYVRKDLLTVTIAHAQLLCALLKSEDGLQPVDDDSPF